LLYGAVATLTHEKAVASLFLERLPVDKVPPRLLAGFGKSGKKREEKGKTNGAGKTSAERGKISDGDGGEKINLRESEKKGKREKVKGLPPPSFADSALLQHCHFQHKKRPTLDRKYRRSYRSLN